MSEVSLKTKTQKGVVWSLIDNVANQGITFLVGLVLARLLTPKEYGLIGIIVIFISIFNSIVDSGFSNALIRKKNIREIDYDTVFIVNMCLSGIMFIILFLCAPLIAEFFEQPQLTVLTRAMSIIIIINALSIVQLTKLYIQVDFKTQTKISLISSIASGVIGIGMALYGLGVWSLVGQQISRQGLYTIFLWFFGTWRPNFLFSFESFKEMWNFGWKILCTGLLNTIWNELNQIVIGKCYTTASLGQYTRAQQFGGIFSSNLTSMVQRVSFPVLSSIQDDKVRLKLAYQKVIKTTMFVTFLCMLGLFSISKSLIIVLIGEKWLESVYMLRILCFGLMMYPLSAINLNILKVEGRSDILLKLEIIKKIIYVIPILIGIFYNIYALLISSVIAGFIAYCLNAVYSGRLINYSLSEQVKDLFPSFLIACSVAIPTYCISLLSLSQIIILFLQILVGFFTSLIICKVFKVHEYEEIKAMIFTIIKRN